MTDFPPVAAGFDGAKGFRMRASHRNLQIQLKRGKTPPSDHPDSDFKEQLLWFYPDDKPARLLWCNENDQWFELSFNPIQKP
jgi:hypothetical protein